MPAREDRLAGTPVVKSTGRLHFLDATRGVLACVVAAHHTLMLATGREWLSAAADVSVMCFFVMSGYVLARAYDGRVGAFCLRRIVRLWPTYLVCLLAGHALAGGVPSLRELAWLPSSLNAAMLVDRPVWSLYAEAWATFGFPLAFALPGRILPVLAIFAGCGLTAWYPPAFPVPLFLAGVAAARFSIPWPDDAPAWLLWLGKISFSLYLSHWVVLTAGVALFGPIGAAVAAVFVPAVAWALWWAVERPSIVLSRRAAR